MGVRDLGKTHRSWRVPALALAALALAGGGIHPARADISNVIYNPATGHYYKWVAWYDTWANAKAGAEALGGYLVSVTSAAEQAWLASYIIPSGQTAHLGGTDESVEGTWVWLSGESWSYSNWNAITSEPNNCCGGENYLAWNSNGTWNDIVGTSGGTSGYVVEWDVNPNTPPTPADPTSLIGVLGPDDHVLLSWTDNSDNESGFEIQRKPSAGSYAVLTTVNPDKTTYDDGNTIPGSTYTYRLRAVNQSVASAWTNEVTVEISLTSLGPVAPSDLQATAVTASSITLGWTDNSDDETGFQVLRKDAAGTFQVVTTVGADVVEYAASGLAPDTSYSYRVRGVNANGVSGVTEATASTLATLEVSTVKGDLKDSPKTGKDSLKLQARFDFLAESDGTFDPVAEGITIRAGTEAGPVSIALPAGLEGWKVTSTKATWKSARGSLPKYRVDVLFADRLVKVTATGIELTLPPANPMRVSIGIGDDAGTQNLDWLLKKPGLFQYR